MDNGEPRHVLRPSLLARLLSSPTGTGRASAEFDLSASELQDEVRAHLQRLLNTRAPFDSEEIDESFELAKDSLLTYGLPDLSQFSKARKQDQERIRSLIRNAVTRFEPRLNPKTVEVEFDEPDGGDDKKATPGDNFRIRFRISGILDVDPIRKDIMFDAHVDSITGNIAIEGEP